MKRIIAAVVLVVGLASPAKAADNWKCPQWYKLARQVGFARSDWPKLDAIMYRESRCRPEAKGVNKLADGTVWSTDMGLTQINNYSWITYLRSLGIAKQSTDLLQPRVNLLAAKALYDYSKARGFSPWHQWRTAGSGSWNK